MATETKEKKDDKTPAKTVTPKKKKAKKRTGPSITELSLRLAVVETRLSALVDALKSSKGLKGI
jgi:hypothetical protein